MPELPNQPRDANFNQGNDFSRHELSPSPILTIPLNLLDKIDLSLKLQESRILLIESSPDEINAAFEKIGSQLTNLDTKIAGKSYNSFGLDLPWHVDGIYQSRISEVVSLGCHINDAQGGITAFKDSREIAKTLLDAYPDITEAEIRYERNHDPKKPVATWPIITDFKGEKVLNYRANIPVIEGLEQTVVNLPASIASGEELYSAVNKAIRDTPYTLEHEWSAGETIAFNNRTFIHTRSHYEGPRHLERRRFDFPERDGSTT